MVSAVDLSNCESEPIRIPGSIQPSGMLLCLRSDDWSVLQASGNCASNIGLANTEELLSKSLRTLLSPADAESLASYLKTGQQSSGVALTLGGKRMMAEAHVQTAGNIDLVLLELEIIADQPTDPMVIASLLSGPIDSMQQATSVVELLDLMVKQVQMHTGYDRVMMYKFDQEANGEVVAEQLTGNLSPYMGLRFPASDIPKQARELFSKNWIRIIPDVHYQPSPLVPVDNPLTNAPLDLGQTVFRAVSPIHIEYLHNMQVGASMSISIIVRGQLWGLVACHNLTPKAVPHDVRTTCQLLGKLLSVRLSALQEQDTNKVVHQQQGMLALLRSAIAGNDTVADGIAGTWDTLMVTLDLDALHVYSDDQWHANGMHVEEELITSICTWMENSDRTTFVSAEMSRDLPPAIAKLVPAEISGLCAVRITSPKRLCLLGLRKELVRKITWGGDPNKAMETEGGTQRLHPRKSFAAYVETVVGQSAPWLESDVRFITNLSAVLQDATTQKEYRKSADALSLSQERDDVVSGLAHDLKAPLIAAIKTSQALAAGRFGAIDGLPKEMVRLVIESQQELLGRLEAMLSVYRQEVLGISILSRPLHLNELIEAAMGRLQFSFAAKQLKTYFDCQRNVIVLGDQDALMRAIENLLSNAAKFSPDSSEVTVTCRQQDGQALLTVSDCGPGIAASDRNRLFTRFGQGSAGKSTTDGSHGLGLYLTKRIVEAHGGKITCTSADGEGATFEVTLPLHQEEVASARIVG